MKLLSPASSSSSPYGAACLMMVVVASVASVIVSAATATATTVVDERAVLLELFEATGGNSWNENYGWAENLPDLCTWHGVICDLDEEDKGKGAAVTTGGVDDGVDSNVGGDERRHRRRTLQEQNANDNTGSGLVKGLKLNANFLTGRTPAKLWDLPSLVDLDVSYNPSLDVDLVGLVGSSSRLERLAMRQTGTTSVTGLSAVRDTLVAASLSENVMESQIPPDLYDLTKLTSLHLAGCNLRGTVPDLISKLSVLRDLDVYDNSLTGTLPSGLARLVHLRRLTLSRNQFHGSVPPYVNDMVMLEQFWASKNDLTGSLPAFRNSPNLHRLDLGGNSLSGAVPDDFLEATLGGPSKNGGAIIVDLSHNEFTGTIPESLDRLEPLEMNWRLGDNKWTGPVPSELCDNDNWNGGSVADYGCDGLLCPGGTYSRFGHRTDAMECQQCMSAVGYLGSTDCFDKDDRSVLVELYAATGGEGWVRSDGWMRPTGSGEAADVCEWYGVTCWDLGDAKDGRVRWVELPNNNLRGEIPPSVFSLEHLTELDVSRNAVTLSFEAVGEAPHLFSLNVAGTDTKDFDGIEHVGGSFKMLFADQTPIGGTLPREVVQIPHLEVLSMQECDLKGGLPSELFGMTALRELYLSNNDLQGNLPDLWDSLENLKVLALAKNQFRGALPASLGTSPSLVAVSLQDQLTKGGGLTGQIPPYAISRTLAKLMLGNNKLGGELPVDLLAAVEGETLLTVDLSHNEIAGTVPGSFERFKRMDLYLEGNRIAEIDPGLCNNADWMAGSVGSYGCDAILCPAGTKGGRRRFTDDGCQPCGETVASEDGTSSLLGQTTCARPASISGEREILELVYTSMGGVGWHSSENWMTGESICSWYGIDCDESGFVASIQLGSNQLVGSFPTEIYQLRRLVHLKLHGNTVYMNFAGIDEADSLQTLSLDSTGLESLDGVGQARSLRELNVGHNKLTGVLPEEMSRLINLQTLDISHNQFGGYLPFWLRGLVSLTTFAASHNKFSGPVSDFASLSNLLYLDLSFNELSGTVPATLLTDAPVDENEKVVVDFAHNKIDGTIPADLSRISRLSLQLQDNRISEIDPKLCEMEGFNDFDVLSFGCNGILCPAGSWNHLGRQSNEDLPCEPCDKAEFMGATHCGKSNGSVTTPGPVMAIVTALAGGAVLFELMLL